MATDDTTASIITLHPKKSLTPAERAKAYRERKRQKAGTAVDKKPASSDLVAPAPEIEPAVTAPIVGPVMSPATLTVTPSRHSLPSIMLTVAAISLAGVGVTMNGWFARSLGSSDIAGWLFLAVGVAADLVALAVPSCAATLWQTRQRGTAAAAWLVWLATFAFAVMAGVGFAAVNITDVTASRASRVTPAVTQAQTALTDAMAARDRECGGGVGRNCRAREDAVVERRRLLDAAQSSLEQNADPQIEAVSRIVAWLSAGQLRPTGADFAMLRLILLALLPQIGGILLMIGKRDG